RITHGKASTIAQFGIEAGRGEQRVRQAAEAETNARQQAAINAQAEAGALRASTDIAQSVLNANSRREAMEFESFMRGESAKRAIAWEQEKTELRNLHDFDMLEQRRETENQLAIDSDSRQKQKTDSKIQALRDAHEQGQISEKEMNDEILRIELGIPGSQSPLFKKKDEASVFADLLSERDAGGDVAPEQTNSAALLELANSTATSNEVRQDIKAILSTGDPVKIKHALDILTARQTTTGRAEALGKATAGVPRRPGDDPVFGRFAVGL
ncbi:hypothetical protein LCGC14_1721450, partial [marine sediment metagenome]